MKQGIRGMLKELTRRSVSGENWMKEGKESRLGNESYPWARSFKDQKLYKCFRVS